MMATERIEKQMVQIPSRVITSKKAAKSLPAVPVLQQKTAVIPHIQRKINNTHLLKGIKNFDGHNRSEVKADYNSVQPMQLQAHAQDTDTRITPGKEKHSPEAWHVMQQKQERALPNMQTKVDGNGVVQRMSLIIGDTNGIDNITAEDIAVTTKIAGGEIKPLNSINDNNTEIRDGEIIALIGHGEIGEIEGISADDISDYLLKIKNIGKAKVIYVSSCMSAVGHKNDGKELKDTSTINKIASKLKENGVTVATIGFAGSAIHQFDNSGNLAPDIVVNPEADMDFAFKWQTEIANEEGFDLKTVGSLLGDNPTINLELVYQNLHNSHNFYARLGQKFDHENILLPADKSIRLIKADGDEIMLTPKQALEFLIKI